MSLRGALEELGLIERSFPRSFQKGFSQGIFGFINPSSLPKMGEREYLRSYNGRMFACVNAIAERVADIELKLQTKTGNDWKDVTTPQPAMQLLHDVNAFMSFTPTVLLS